MIRRLWCAVFGHTWKSQISGERVITWKPTHDSYIVCDRCGLSFSSFWGTP